MIKYSKEIVALFKYYGLYFVPIESKYASFSGYREYVILERIMGDFIALYLSHYTDVTNLDIKKYEINLLLNIYDMQKKYSDILMADFVSPFLKQKGENIKLEKYVANKKKIFNLSLYQQTSHDLQQCKRYIDMLESEEEIEKNLNTTTDAILSAQTFLNKLDTAKIDFDPEKAIKNASTGKDIDYGAFEMLLKYFLCAHQLCKKFFEVVKNVTEKESYKATSLRPYIIEFNQFLTHLSYAMIVDHHFDITQNQNAKNYYETNIYRGMRHLERAILDIYKISLTTMAVNSEMMLIKEKSQLLKVRSFELIHLSNSFFEKVNKYHNLLIGTNFFKKHNITTECFEKLNLQKLTNLEDAE